MSTGKPAAPAGFLDLASARSESATKRPTRSTERRSLAAVALLRSEARHLGRSILPATGLVVSALIVVRGVRGVWPSVPGDVLVAYRATGAMAGFAVLTGARLGLRDLRTRCSDLVGASPTKASLLRMVRLSAVALVTMAGFAALFAGATVLSVVRGGHGIPDLRLLADGSLAMALGGCVGFAVGTLTGSSVVSLFAAPVYVLFSAQVFGYVLIHRLGTSLEWITPTARVPDYSAVLGFEPDIFWLHPLYLVGLLSVVGASVVLPANGHGQRSWLRRPATAAALAGFVVAAAAGGALAAKPDSVLPTGPDLSTWVPLRHQLSDLMADRPFAYPDDRRATACASGSVLDACVYPAYGSNLARRIVRVLDPEAALFLGFPGVPDTVRMVPAGSGGSVPCVQSGGDALFWEGDASLLLDPYFDLRGYLLKCAFIPTGSSFGFKYGDAQSAVILWAFVQTGRLTRQDMAHAEPDGESCDPACQPVWMVGSSGDWDPGSVRGARRLLWLSRDAALHRLRAVWAPLTAGTLPVDSLLPSR